MYLLNPRHERESAQIYIVRVALFVLKIENLSHIMCARRSEDLLSSFPELWLSIQTASEPSRGEYLRGYCIRAVNCTLRYLRLSH